MTLWEKIKRLFGMGEPVTTARTAPSAAPAPAASAPSSWPQILRPAPRAPKPAEAPNPYEGGNEILGLSADELRKRALKINPSRTAWIGRVDTIPPQSDERTAIIDRGLVLRGLLNEEQLAEIHRIGDLWLRHHEASKLAAQKATVIADQTVEAMRQERAERKARKKREAEERRKKRAEEVARRKAEDIIFAGTGVSSGTAGLDASFDFWSHEGLARITLPRRTRRR